MTIATFNVYFGLLMFFTGGKYIYDLPGWWTQRVVARRGPDRERLGGADAARGGDGRRRPRHLGADQPHHHRPPALRLRRQPRGRAARGHQRRPHAVHRLLLDGADGGHRRADAGELRQGSRAQRADRPRARRARRGRARRRAAGRRTRLGARLRARRAARRRSSRTGSTSSASRPTPSRWWSAPSSCSRSRRRTCRSSDCSGRSERRRPMVDAYRRLRDLVGAEVLGLHRLPARRGRSPSASPRRAS